MELQDLKGKHRHLWTALKIVIGLGLVLLVVRGIRWEELRESWRAIWWLPFGLLIAFRFPMLATRAWRWAVLLGHKNPCPSVGRLTRVLLKAELFNNFLPSTAGGDIYRVVATKSACSTPTATAAVLAARANGMIVLVVSALIAVATNPTARHTYIGQAVTVVALLVLGGGAVVWAGRGRVSQWLRKRAQADGSGAGSAILRYTWKYYQALEEYSERPRQLGKALLLSIVLLAGLVTSTYLLCLSVGAVPGFVDLVTVALTVALISFLPIFVNGLGGREAAFIIMFQQVGVSPSQAALIALLSRAGAVIIAIIAALVYLYDSSRASAASSSTKPKTVEGKSKSIAGP